MIIYLQEQLAFIARSKILKSMSLGAGAVMDADADGEQTLPLSRRRNCCSLSPGAVLRCSRLLSLSGLHTNLPSVMVQTPSSLGHAVKK